MWSWGTLVAFEERVLGTQSSGPSAPTLQRAGECCSHTVPHPSAQDVTVQAQVSFLLPLFGREQLCPLSQGDGSQCHSVPGALRVSQSCCKTVPVLPGEKPPLPVLHLWSPAGTKQLLGPGQLCRRDAAVGTVEGRRILLWVGPTLKEHTELWPWIPVGHSAPCPLVLLQLL